MNNERLASKTRQIIRTDRLESMRAYADKKRSYCFFASVYEAAYHIHDQKMPSRFKQAEQEWLSSGISTSTGAVPPQETLSLLVKLSNSFGVQIDKIYANYSFLPQFNPDANMKSETNDSSPDQSKVRYLAHAEARTFLNRSSDRADSAIFNGWFVVMAITFAGQLPEGGKNSFESIPIEDATGQSLVLQHPYILVMLREK